MSQSAFLSLYRGALRDRARRMRAIKRAMLALDSARGGFFGFGKTRSRQGKAKKLMVLPKTMRVKGGFYYVSDGTLYVKKR